MQPQNITSFLDQNHLVVESDNQLFNFSGQRNLNRTAIASRAIKQGEIIYNIQPYSYTEEPNFLSSNSHFEKNTILIAILKLKK